MDTKIEIQKLIAEALQKAFSVNVPVEEIHLEHPADRSHGDWATNVAMALTKEIGQNPRQIAEQLVATFPQKVIVEKVEVAGPGFVNFTLAKEVLWKSVLQVLSDKDSYGNSGALQGKRIMVEFAHPNPFKSFHIGHLRNIILGESICRMLESQGAEIVRTNYQGDVGMHIAKCLWSLRTVDSANYPTSADEKVALLGKNYALGAQAFEESEEAKSEIKEINKKIYSKEDPEINRLWDLGKDWSLEKFHEIYERMGTSFAREYMESEVSDDGLKRCHEALEKGILEESDGAIVFRGDKYGLDTRVFINSEGLPTYEGKEMGLAYREFTDFGDIDLCIHNVGSEQISFFKVTFKVEELLSPELFAGKQYHNAYELVGLKSGKMSSRKGQVVLGNDILNEAVQKIIEVVKQRGDEQYDAEMAEKVGVGAVKFSFLKVSAFKYLAFDMDASLSFEGDSGPYVQYTYARAMSLLREAGEVNPPADYVGAASAELAIMAQLIRFAEIVQLAVSEYSPHHIVGYLSELGQLFSSFYNQFPVLKESDEKKKKARIALTAATAQVIKNGLRLLGIETVERM